MTNADFWESLFIPIMQATENFMCIAVYAPSPQRKALTTVRKYANIRCKRIIRYLQTTRRCGRFWYLTSHNLTIMVAILNLEKMDFCIFLSETAVVPMIGMVTMAMHRT